VQPVEVKKKGLVAMRGSSLLAVIGTKVESYKPNEENMMDQFTIPQRKAYVKMLEEIHGKVQYRSSYGNPERKQAQEAMEKKLGLEKLKRQVEEVEEKVRIEVSKVDARYHAERRQRMKEIALGIASIWCCESATEGREIVERFLKADYPEAQE
jgi:hypothetical protein